MNRIALIALLAALWGQAAPSGASQDATPEPLSSVALELVADELVDPVSVRQPPNNSGRLFIVEKIGRIRIFENGILLDEPFLNIVSTTISTSAEQGLYDIAFHPQFATNGLVYISHTERYLDGALVVWEYRLDAPNANKVNRLDRRPVIAIQRRAMFHNGGTIAFGPDGYLYLGVGEGRPYQNTWSPARSYAQSLDNLDGKLLRIDVAVPVAPDGDPAASYLVPENPFGGPTSRTYAYRADMDMGRGQPFPEIWAIGLRNPWHFVFDTVSGDLYLPDVGEFDMEEINWQSAASAGGENLGWDTAEGFDCGSFTCAGFVAPVHAYPHDTDHCAVIGLGVSHTVFLPMLEGAFLFSDFCAGEVEALSRRSDQWMASPVLVVSQYAPDRQVSGGGTDLEGNVYVTTCTCTPTFGITPVTGQERRTGAVWRLVPIDGSASTTQRPSPIAAIPSLVEETRTTIAADRLFTSRYRRETT